MNNNSFFELAFGRIKGIIKEELCSYITVRNSRDVVIAGNEFVNNYFYNDAIFHHSMFPSASAKSVRIPFESKCVTDKIDRASCNIDYLKRFIYECPKQGVEPIVRCTAFFSHISSIRSRQDMSDYNQLVLAEKDLFDEMLARNFRVKLIISLDVPLIMTQWYNKPSEMICRISDLTDRVDKVCEHSNIEIVIDEYDQMHSQFILHDALWIHAAKADPIGKYSYTEYETNPHAIQNAIATFDNHFQRLAITNYAVRNHLRLCNMSDFIKETVDCRLEDMNRHLSTQ